MNLNKQNTLIKNLLFTACMLIYVSTFALANNNGRICGRIIEQATKLNSLNIGKGAICTTNYQIEFVSLDYAYRALK